MAENNIIQNSSDFLFIYEAIQCNPNGNPDQENKPRMDYDTKTNLVTDTRVKRFIRDYLKDKGFEIFVDMEGERQVTIDKKLEYVVKRSLEDEDILEKVFQDNENALKLYKDILEKSKNFDAVWKDLKDKKLKEINVEFLKYLIKNQFIDIRMFGSAFAVEGFNKAYTGPIQMNWGYSLNKVELIDSSSIVTIMNEDSSTFGKDYRVHYSLLAFNGTINKNSAPTTGLTDKDRELFRDAIWHSIPASPTRSKLNQYPKLYFEIIYNDGFTNGQFGDLRNYVEAHPLKEEPVVGNYKKVRKFSHLELNFSKLKGVIQKYKGKEIKDVIVRTSTDLSFSI